MLLRNVQCNAIRKNFSHVEVCLLMPSYGYFLLLSTVDTFFCTFNQSPFTEYQHNTLSKKLFLNIRLL